MYSKIYIPEKPTRLGEAQTTPLSLTTNTTIAALELRIQAQENELQSLKSAIGQHSSACGCYVSFPLGTHSLSSPTHDIRINTSPHTTAGFGSDGLTRSQSDLQDEVTGGLDYGSSIMSSLQLNTAINASGLNFQPIAFDNPENLHSDLSVNTERRLDISPAIVQDWNASSMINNEPDNGNFVDPMLYLVAASNSNQDDVDLSGGTVSQMISNPIDNTFGGVQSFDDTMDITATYTAYGMGANVDYTLPDANYGDAHSFSPVVTPSNAALTSSATQGSTSRPRIYRCGVSMNCHKTFARRADRDRHNLTHDRTSIRPFSCPFNGCNKVGTEGFWREDKFKEHRVRMGH